MTNNTTNNNEQNFETDHWYAIFSGWLIFPALVAFFALIGSAIMVIFVNPAELSGFDLMIYWVDAISLPLLLIIFYTWFTRKRIMPILIIIFFIINVLFNLSYFIAGYGIDMVNLAVSIIWIVYFIRSKRVKVTFIR